MLTHLKLEFAVAVHEIGIREKVQPVIHVDVERSEQTLVFKCPALQHFLRFDLARRTEEVDEQRAHLPPVAHLFDHDAGNRTAIIFRRRGFKQVALLLDAGKFSVALVDDHVHQGVAHLLRGHLAQVLPLVAAFVGTELDLPGFDRAVECVEVKRLNAVFVDADFLPPFVEYSHPPAEASYFRYFAWHKASILYHRGPRGPQGKPTGAFPVNLCAPCGSSSLSLRCKHSRTLLNISGQSLFRVITLEQDLLVLALDRQRRFHWNLPPG